VIANIVMVYGIVARRRSDRHQEGNRHVRARDQGTQVRDLRTMTPPLTLTTAIQIAAAYDELCAQGGAMPPDPDSLD